MKTPLRFPLRLKILVSLLFVVTVVVSLITFTMARLFHEDKKTYVNDLAAMVAKSTADESRVVLTGIASRLQVYSRIMSRDDVSAEGKAALVEGFFQDFPELVSVRLYVDKKEIAAAFDQNELEQAGVSKDDITAYRHQHLPPFDELEPGTPRIAGAEIAGKLRTLDVTVLQLSAGGTRQSVLTAIVRPHSIERLVSRSKLFDTYLVTNEGQAIVFSDEARREGRTHVVLPEGARQALSGYTAGRTIEFDLDGRTMVGGFAPVGVGGLTAIAQVPAAAAFLASRDLLRGLIFMALGLLVVTAVISVFWARRITRPLEGLSEATRKIAQGEFDVQVDVSSRDEIGSLGGSFNQMASELSNREAALKEAQAQLVQSEKMAAFGQLGAGIAHEVKNPLAGILGCAQLSLRMAEKGSQLRTNIELIEKESKRCKTILDNLLRFARQEKTVYGPVQVNAVVEDAAAIVRHQMELKRVKLEVELAPALRPIRGNGNQLQQVLMNLMMNAQQAMEDNPGSITVSTHQTNDETIEVRVSDDGPGIPPDIQKKIFEPFFTTKPGGKGTGLGLSVSFGIVKDHGGEIRLDSTPGRGAVFTIALPVSPNGNQITPPSPEQTDRPETAADRQPVRS